MPGPWGVFDWRKAIIALINGLAPNSLQARAMINLFSHEYMRHSGRWLRFRVISTSFSCDIASVSWRLISYHRRLDDLFKENMKVPCNTSPLWWESTGDRHVFFFTKCQWRDIWYTNVTQSGITFCFCSVWTIYFPNNCWLIFSNDNQFIFFATGNTPCNKSQLAHRSLVDG